MIDNNYDGRGAFASIIDGGPHQNHTKILLKSQPGGTINNKITIYAYRHSPLGWNVPLQLQLPSPLPAIPFRSNSNGIIHHQQPPPQQPTHHKSYFPWSHFHKK